MWLEVLYSRHYAGFGGVTELTASTSLWKLHKFLWPPTCICARLLRVRWMMVVNFDQNRQLQHGQEYPPPSPSEPRRLEASEAQNHCWIQQVNNELGYQHHTSMYLESCRTSSLKKPGNIEGSQTVEYQCLSLSTSNQFAEQIHLCTRAGERGYQVYTHAGCVAEKNQYFAWHLQWFLSYFLASVLNCRRILLTLKYKTW